MVAEGDPGGEWTVQFLEIQKCSAIGNACLYKRNQCKEILNTKISTLLLDVT